MLRIDAPPGSRCVAVQVTGERAARYWVSSLRVAGHDVVPRAAPRLGTFAMVYPSAPGQPAPSGTVELVVASDRPGAARVRVLVPRDDGSRVLHVVLVTVTSAPHDGDLAPAIAVATRLLAAAGVELAVDGTPALRGTDGSTIARTDEPWETPDSPSARLAEHGAQLLATDALPVYVVDRLPDGYDGVTLGLPGPFDEAAPYYRGVVVRRAEAADLGRAIAHELAHYLGLAHVRSVELDGSVHEDGIADTAPGDDNLMAHGTRLTPGQAFVLSRSPLLRRN